MSETVFDRIRELRNAMEAHEDDEPDYMAPDVRLAIHDVTDLLDQEDIWNPQAVLDELDSQMPEDEIPETGELIHGYYEPAVDAEEDPS